MVVIAVSPCSPTKGSLALASFERPRKPMEVRRLLLQSLF